MTLTEALSDYLAENQLSPSMQGAVCHAWSRFSEFCEAHDLSQLGQLKSSHLEAFQQRLLWEPGPAGRMYSASTVYQVLNQVRNLTRWATSAKHLAIDPGRHLLLSRPVPPQVRELTWAELQAILAATDPAQPVGVRDGALYAMIAETNLGVRDCLALDLRDQAGLKLEPRTAELLRAYVQEVRPTWVRNPGQRAIFLTIHGGRLGPITVGHRLNQLAELAGVDGPITPRMLWRSYRAAMARSGDSRFPFNRDP